MNIGIFYGSKQGATKAVCEFISKELDCEIFDIKDTKIEKISQFDLVILASSSYAFGELEESWQDKINELKNIKFDGKKVALIGVGNLQRHQDSFCSAIVDFLPYIKAANLIGSDDLNGYSFKNSSAFINGKFIGLCVDFKGDENWQKRAKNWCENLKISAS